MLVALSKCDARLPVGARRWRRTRLQQSGAVQEGLRSLPVGVQAIAVRNFGRIVGEVYGASNAVRHSGLSSAVPRGFFGSGCSESGGTGPALHRVEVVMMYSHRLLSAGHAPLFVDSHPFAFQSVNLGGAHEVCVSSAASVCGRGVLALSCAGSSCVVGRAHGVGGALARSREAERCGLAG